MADEKTTTKPDAVDKMKTTKVDNKQFNEAFTNRGKKAEANINSTVDNTLNTQKTDLKNAYNQNKTAQTEAGNAGQIAYNNARADVNVQATKNERDLDRFADARNLNRQEGSQQRLQLTRARQTAAGNVVADQQRALQETQRQQELLMADYQNQIKIAIANRDYKRAAALYDNWNNQNAHLDKTAALLFQNYGIVSGYKRMYGPDSAQTMQQFWNGTNPDAAYNTGRIGASRYKNITGNAAPDKVPASTPGGSQGTINADYWINGRPGWTEEHGAPSQGS